MSLHILNNRDSFERCRALLQSGDALMLIENACYHSAAIARALQASSLDLPVYYLDEHAAERGVIPPDRCQPVDMEGFVELCGEHRHCLSC